MQKSARALALVAVLSLAATSSLHAEQMGTNPRPTGHALQTHWQSFVYNVRSYFGL